MRKLSRASLMKRKIIVKIINSKMGDVCASTIVSKNRTLHHVRDAFKLLQEVGFGRYCINNRGHNRIHKFHKVTVDLFRQNFLLQDDMRNIGILPKNVVAILSLYPSTGACIHVCRSRMHSIEA